MKQQSGFTLIELLLVLAIIGIIAAIAIPALLGQREKARRRAVMSNANAIAGELARVAYDLTEKTGAAPNATSVVNTVLLMSNYTNPTKARNPYAASPAYVGTVPALGQVGLISISITDPASGEVKQAVRVDYNVKNSAGTAAVVSGKVIAID